jgi:hypothetical protein
MVDCMKFGAKVIPDWLVPVLLRLRLIVFTFSEMFGAPFEVFILLLFFLNGLSNCVCGGLSLYVIYVYHICPVKHIG